MSVLWFIKWNQSDDSGHHLQRIRVPGVCVCVCVRACVCACVHDYVCARMCVGMCMFAGTFSTGVHTHTLPPLLPYRRELARSVRRPFPAVTSVGA